MNPMMHRQTPSAKGETASGSFRAIPKITKQTSTSQTKTGQRGSHVSEK
jgi:hypothetical protein